MDQPQTYRCDQTWRWNLDHAPRPASVAASTAAPRFRFCGLPVASPLGISAGPLLNGRWILHYAGLGFDILTYKTVRSVARDCYPLPNLQPVETDQLTGSESEVPATDQMRGSWAVSFGMPSLTPDQWQQDIQWTREQLPPDKVLVVSVVGTESSGMTTSDLADDYARCAQWAVDAGADAVEMNFSCPNVTTSDGQLYQDSQAARTVASKAREAVGDRPLIAKIGRVPGNDAAAELLDALGPLLDGIAMTNSIAAQVRDADGNLLFDGQRRGICGDATRTESVRQTAMFASALEATGQQLALIGVGGISSGDHVQQYLDAGAESVQLATAVMTEPDCGRRIREQLNW